MRSLDTSLDPEPTTSWQHRRYCCRLNFPEQSSQQQALFANKARGAQHNAGASTANTVHNATDSRPTDEISVTAFFAAARPPYANLHKPYRYSKRYIIFPWKPPAVMRREQRTGGRAARSTGALQQATHPLKARARAGTRSLFSAPWFRASAAVLDLVAVLQRTEDSAGGTRLAAGRVRAANLWESGSPRKENRWSTENQGEKREMCVANARS